MPISMKTRSSFSNIMGSLCLANIYTARQDVGSPVEEMSYSAIHSIQYPNALESTNISIPTSNTLPTISFFNCPNSCRHAAFLSGYGISIRSRAHQFSR